MNTTCPLQQQRFYRSNEPPNVDRYCKREECSWWVPKNGCVIYVIGLKAIEMLEKG